MSEHLGIKVVPSVSEMGKLQWSCDLKVTKLVQRHLRNLSLVMQLFYLSSSMDKAGLSANPGYYSC